PDLPDSIAYLQKQVERLFLERTALERELNLLRLAPPVVVTRPKRSGLLMRALRRAVPALRRRHELNVVRDCGLFDADWYRAEYPDVPRATDPARHFLLHGAKDQRDPGPLFDTRHYIQNYPDIVAMGVNPLVHYVTAGIDEGRVIRSGMTHGEVRG
ncbi:MAG: hypothetical protein ACPGFC_12385, partial [Paracoccaceae bacterium]